MQAGESSTQDKCSNDCPFCQEKEYKNYKTKHGELKDERKLASNLRAESEITSDTVGNIYPLPGGSDKTIGWEAKAGVLEDFPVEMAAAPHHIIPGKASMAPSRLETWTLEEKGKIKEDVGYNIDCAQNGIFLPHLPEIYWTRHKPGTKIPMSKYYGQTWTDLSSSSKESIGFIIMGETNLQMHYTDHDDPYINVDNESTYDDECKQECNHLADFMNMKSMLAKCEDDDGKLDPPYILVYKINAKSREIKGRITGSPQRWTSWVSPLAQEYTHKLRSDSSSPLSSYKGLIKKLTK